MLLLIAVLLVYCNAAASKNIPHWVGTQPNSSAHAAGLPLLAETRRITVYNSSLHDGSKNPVGLYNHGPMLIRSPVDGSFICMWYNAPERESHQMRVLIATSFDMETWSEPIEVFPSVNSKGEENEPFAMINGSVYAVASDISWNNTHDSGVRGATLMRRLLPAPMGEVFWVTDYKPPHTYTNLSFPLYTELGRDIQSDVNSYLARQINTTMVSNVGRFNERSLYERPGHAGSLVLLIRGGIRHQNPQLWTSVCQLPRRIRHNAATKWYTCQSGTGAYEYKTVTEDVLSDISYSTARSPHTTGSPHPQECNWSQPVATNIPDAPSRTCAGGLPDGSIGVVGNQGGGSRDPLTFMTAADGLAFDKHWAVESGAPKPKWFGPPGFQYPSYMWC